MKNLQTESNHKFLTKSIDSRSIPTPKLIIKDHKKQDQNGDYPSRLIVPASNFISGFPRLGYLGIRRILDENKINYEKRTIVQASTLKMEIEKMKLKKREVTIAKLDIVAMYPSIQFLIVKKAVRYFARELSSENNQKIEKCLEMIGFGMKNTLVSFIDKYYEYGGEMEDEKRGLTIGGYESAWLADLVAAYLLEMTKEKFDNFVYHGIYRDDGFMVLKGTRTEREMSDWLEDFQGKINEMTESTCLQFTAEVWGIEKDPEVNNDKLEVVNEKVFPYLDMEMRWNEKEELRFIKLMKKATSVMVTANETKGSQTVDHYSMMGFTKAYNTAKKNCS